MHGGFLCFPELFLAPPAMSLAGFRLEFFNAIHLGVPAGKANKFGVPSRDKNVRIFWSALAYNVISIHSPRLVFAVKFHYCGSKGRDVHGCVW